MVLDVLDEITLTRRTFLKVAAVSGAAAALGLPASDALVEADEAFATSPVERKKVKSSCHGCIQTCPVIVHMDGDLKPLWDMIPDTGIRGIDSFSPPPDNDTKVSEAVAMWPEMRILVNFPSSVHVAPPERIYEAAMEILEQGGHTGRLWIQISENVPPDRWKVSFPQIVRATLDFGTPGGT